MMAPGEARATLLAAGLPGEAAAEWAAAAPQGTGEYDADRGRFGAHWSAGDRLLHALPPKPRRTEAEAAAAAALLAAGRASRDRFLAAHAPRVYDALTTGRTRFPGVEDVAYAAAELVPGLAPTRAGVAAEAALDQRDKDGVEIHQGLVLSRVLADAQCGLHLCHAGLLPCPESAEAAARFAREGRLDLGAARLERRGRVAHLFSANPRFLNAEDDDTIAATEQAVDVATLDPGSDIAVLRGAPVEHPKYAGRPVFGAGINLTHLYRGRIPFLWYLRRELGWVHKLLRGVATPEAPPDDVQGPGVEQPRVAAEQADAIGGH